MSEDGDDEPQYKPLPSKNKNPLADAPFKIEGNVPQEFLDRLMSTQAEDEDDAPRQQRQRPAREQQVKKQNKTSKFSNEPSQDFESNDSLKYKEIVDRLKEYSHQYDEITLPSLGVFYGAGEGPQDGILHVRRMTGKEEEILATTRYFREGKIVDMILENCIKEKYRPEDLLVVDRDYILVYIRGISYSTDYEVEIKCPMCEKRFTTVIELNSFVINDCPEDFNQNSLNLILPDSQLQVKYKISRGRDESAVQAYKDRKIKNNFDSNDDSDDTLLYRMSVLISDIEGISDKHQIMSIIEQLPISDVNYLRGKINDLPFGMDTQIALECRNCGEDFETSMPMGASFFFPRVKKNEKKPNQL
jgi:protein-arginine kinase activator protein McsA